MSLVLRIDAVTFMPAEFMPSRRSASVPLPVARVTVASLRSEFAVKLPSLFHVPKENVRLPVPVDAVSLE